MPTPPGFPPPPYPHRARVVTPTGYVLCVCVCDLFLFLHTVNIRRAQEHTDVEGTDPRGCPPRMAYSLRRCSFWVRVCACVCRRVVCRVVLFVCCVFVCVTCFSSYTRYEEHKSIHTQKELIRGGVVFFLQVLMMMGNSCFHWTSSAAHIKHTNMKRVGFKVQLNGTQKHRNDKV